MLTNKEEIISLFHSLLLTIMSQRRQSLAKQAFREQQLQRWGHRSCISGSTEDLTVRAFWPDIPLNDWNCVVVTKKENMSIAHSKNWSKIYPDEVVDFMEGHRRVDELVRRELEEFERQQRVDRIQ